MAVTLKQIADIAGLSVSAVSQIINRRECNFCSDARKEEVFRIARELGYKQKFADKIKRGDQTRTVAILKRNNLTMEANNLAMLMLNKFEEIGYSCYVVNFDRDCDALPRVRDLIDRGVERFVLMGPVWGGNADDEKEKYQALTALIERNKRTYISYGASTDRYVMQDFAPAVRETVEFFQKNGADEFKMLLPDTGSNREKALCACFPELSTSEVREKYIHDIGEIYSLDTIDDVVKRGYCETQKVLKLYPGIKGIYYLSDQLALGGVRCLLERGIVPGKDILLAGFNDFPGARYCGYPISTAAHDLEALASALVEESGKSGECHIEIAPKIILREKQTSLV